MPFRSVIVGSGSCIPPQRVSNQDLIGRDFWGADCKRIAKPNAEILAQFEAITGIRERRYADDSQVASDLAAEAARDALSSSGVDKEELDTIVVAHNFGDVPKGSR